MTTATSLSVSEIARLSGRKTITVHQWIRRKMLPAKLEGNRYVIRRDDYLKFVEERRARGVQD